MYAFGFTATARTTGKHYTCIGTTTGKHYIAHGPAGKPLARTLDQWTVHPDAAAVVETVRDRYTGKINPMGHGEYEVDFCGIMRADEAHGPAELLAMFVNQSAEEFTVCPTITATITAFRSLTANGGFTPATSSTRQTPRVSERTEGLRPAPGETFTRPNGEEYRPRMVGDHVDVMLLRKFRSMPRAIHALLIGPSGSGKTAVAEVAHPDLITIASNGDMTVAQIVGQLMPMPGGGWEFKEGPLTLAMREGRALLIDEINKLPDEVIAVLHSAGDGRGYVRLDDRPDDPIVYAAPGFCMLGTLNPDKLGSTGLPEAITSRFGVPITVTTDFAAARSMGVPEEFVTVCENLTTRNTENPEGFDVWVPQMRELLTAKALIDAGLGKTFAAQSMLAQCPNPEDLPIVAEVMAHVFGMAITPPSLGAQA